MKTNKRKIRLVCVFLSVVMALGIFGGICASGETQTGSFEIYCHGTTDKGERIELSGAEIELYRVGDYKDGVWVLNQEFSPSGTDLGDMSASAQRDAAQQLYGYAVEENIKGDSGFTGSDGKLVFDGVEIGLYLVAMKGEYEYEDGFFRSLPFLLTMPIKTEEGTIYDFTAEPKTEWVSDDEEPTTEPTPTEPTKPTEPTEPTEDTSSPTDEPTEPTEVTDKPTSPTTNPTTNPNGTTKPTVQPTTPDGESQQTGDNRDTENMAFLCLSLSIAAVIILKRKSKEE